MMIPRMIDFTEAKPAGAPAILREELYRADTHDFNLVRIDPLMGPPPHPYPAGDSFMFVVTGLINLEVDGAQYELKTGQMAIIPKGAARGFKAGPEGAVLFAAHLRG